MYVRITPTEKAHLVEPEVLTALSVQIVGDAPATSANWQLRRRPRLARRRRAARAAAHEIGVADDWDEQFDGMLAFAKSQGLAVVERQRAARPHRPGLTTPVRA